MGSDFKPRDILAQNLRRLIDSEGKTVRAWAMGKGLDVRMIDRLIKSENAVTLDKLGEIEEACGLEPWHLLLEDFAPGETPEAPITEEDRAMLLRLRKLLDK